MDKKFNFTQKDLFSIPPAGGTRATDYHDLQALGLVLQVTNKGVKSFYLRRKKNGESERIFIETKWAWQSLLSAATIENLRLHDLRRTLGRYMAMGNQSLYVIGKVLGHKSPNSTQIYSHFTHDPLRQAMGKAHGDVKQAAIEAANRK